MRIPPIPNSNNNLWGSNDPNQCWNQIIQNMGSFINQLGPNPTKADMAPLQGFYFALVTVAKKVGGSFQSALEQFKDDYKNAQKGIPGAVSAMKSDVGHLLSTSSSIELTPKDFEDLYLNGTPPSHNSIQKYFLDYFKTNGTQDTLGHLKGFMSAFQVMAESFCPPKFNSDLSTLLNSSAYHAYTGGDFSQATELKSDVSALANDL